MDYVEAHEWFAAHESKGRELFEPALFVNGAPAWPAGAVAAVSLAGYLDDAVNEEDLIAGLEHFKSLIRAELVDEKVWYDEAAAVIAAIIEWGDAQGIEL
jgi:hypothetical protein